MKKTTLLLLSIIFSLACEKKVDLVVHNARVYTSDDNYTNISSFVVDEGRFIEVGGEELVEKYKSINTVNARGLPVFPGFIDSHCHLLSLGLKKFEVDLKGTKSFEEIIDKLKDYSSNKKLSVIRGAGWDQNDWDEKELPNKNVLDVLFPNIPVVLTRIDGHAMLVNQRAIDMAGITIETKSEGGEIVKHDGKLTGVIIDRPMELIERIIPKYTRDEKIKALKSAEKICFEHGITTVDEAGLIKSDILLIDSLHKSKLFDLRVYAMVANDKKSLDYFFKNGPIRKDFLNVSSIKVYADGALGSRGAALKKSYTDKKNHYGSIIISLDSIKKLAIIALNNGFQMNTHAIGDYANSEVLKIYNDILSSTSDPRWRIEHAQVISDDDFPNFNEKIIPSVQPLHATSDMYWAEERLGKSRVKGAYAYKDLLDWSGRLALGTDFPVEDVNPIKTFYAAVSRKDLNQYPAGGYQSENALSRREALLGMTIWGAYANFEENLKGSITPGKYADFVILDRDIMEIETHRIPSARVVATILNGEIVYSTRFDN
tara:strand:+ start:6725 stop:8356 length:1632 start_codon:yes stop_codon:yes gene_type:complete